MVGVDVAVEVSVGVAVGVSAGVLVCVPVAVLVGVDVSVGVVVGVSFGLPVGVSVGVSLGVALGVSVGVNVALHPSMVSKPASVTSPAAVAKARPARSTGRIAVPAPMWTPACATTFPAKVLPLSVARDVTCQNTLHGSAPLVSTTFERALAVSALPTWKM